MFNTTSYMSNEKAAAKYVEKHIEGDASLSGNSFFKRCLIENSKTQISQHYVLQQINDNLTSIKYLLTALLAVFIFILYSIFKV